MHTVIETVRNYRSQRRQQRPLVARVEQQRGKWQGTSHRRGKQENGKALIREERDDTEGGGKGQNYSKDAWKGPKESCINYRKPHDTCKSLISTHIYFK